MTGQPTPAELTGFVGTNATQARLETLRARDGAIGRVNRISAEMAEDDRIHPEGIASIRLQADRFQTAPAEAIEKPDPR